MLVIRKEQMDVLKSIPRRDFEGSLVRHFSRFYPQDCARLGELQIRKLIQLSIDPGGGTRLLLAAGSRFLFELGMSIINGAALDVPGATLNKCCFAFWNARVDTFVHEIGHHLFMPHSQSAGGEQVRRHDTADAGCIMSYNRPGPAFCGLCQLRLRGWDAGPNSATAILKNVAAQNKKP